MVSSGMKKMVDFPAPATVRNLEEKRNTRMRAASAGLTRGKTPSSWWVSQNQSDPDEVEAATGVLSTQKRPFDLIAATGGYEPTASTV